MGQEEGSKAACFNSSDDLSFRLQLEQHTGAVRSSTIPTYRTFASTVLAMVSKLLAVKASKNKETVINLTSSLCANVNSVTLFCNN